MADQEDDKTTEAETAGEVAAEEAAADPEVTAADVAAEDADAAPAEAPAAPPAAATSAREKRAATRAKEASSRPQRTPEERQAERDAERRRKAAQRRRRREKEKAARTEKRAGAPVAETPPVEHVHGRPKVRLGTVVSDKADKTITVRIDVARRHRRYEKIVRSSSTLHAHDEANDAHEGDLVRVVESRPLSRTKRWRLVEVLERAR
jgi:small subunit ribosomal protein S17